MPKSIYQIKRASIGGKKIGFRVYYYAGNSEVLAVSEVLTSLVNARKNIRAMIKLGAAISKLVMFKK